MLMFVTVSDHDFTNLTELSLNYKYMVLLTLELLDRHTETDIYTYCMNIHLFLYKLGFCFIATAVQTTLEQQSHKHKKLRL
jgi:hypothetical protein